MLRASFLLQKSKGDTNFVYIGDRVTILALCNSTQGPLSVSRFFKFTSIHLEICCGQKCYGRTVGRTDKTATVCFPFGEHKIYKLYIVDRFNVFSFFIKVWKFSLLFASNMTQCIYTETHNVSFNFQFKCFIMICF